MSKRLFVILSFLILAISLLDIKVIPFYKKLGLDFSNNYGFHHCEKSDLSIYKIQASKCADFESRPYVYPPLMHQMFSWTTLFDRVESAYYFFVFLHILSFLLVVYIWTERKWASILFGLGLFGTFPNLFLLERGNSDMFIVLLWSGAYWCYLHQKNFFTGMLLCLSVMAKLYPVFSLIVLMPYFLNHENDRDEIGKSFLVTAIALVLLAPSLWFEYLVDVLPFWNGARTPIYSLSHSLKSINIPMIGSFIYFTCLLFWGRSAFKTHKKNKLCWIWSGALAISTFSNGVSYDYNLVTLFPLAMVGFNYLSKHEDKILSYLMLAMYFTVFGFREVFGSLSIYPMTRLILMIFTIMGIAFRYFDLSHEVHRFKSLTKITV